MALAYHCEECKRGFRFEVTLDNPNHWAKTDKDGPTYCPCCGSYHSVMNGDYLPKKVCELPN